MGGYLFLVGVLLALVWLGFWAAHIFGGSQTPIETEAFKIVAATDLLLLVPALLVGGSLLWRRRPAGPLVAAVAAVQGALYLLVLTINSLIAIATGLAPAPGELPIWAPLAGVTAVAAAILVRNFPAERGDT